MPPAWIDQLNLRTLDPDRRGSVAIASIPLSVKDHSLIAFNGIPSQVLPIAWYPGDQGPGLARQVLVMGVDQETNPGIPDELSVIPAPHSAIVDARLPIAAPTSDPQWAGPKWRSAVIEEKKTGLAMTEVNELVLEHQGRELGLRMGIELVGGGFHWWEWLQIERLWAGPVCTAFRAAGYVGITALTEDEIFSPDASRFGAGNWFHRHNWLFVEVYAQIFVNGLVRVTARHVNNRFFDQGRDLEGFVPVIAFNAAGARQSDTFLDGSHTDLSLGQVQLDLDRGADLFSPKHPARIRSVSDLVVYQPYEGTEMLLGEGQPTDRWNIQAHDKRMWKGMARTFAFDLSFADQPIRTRRFLPPYGYMAYTGALWPDGTLAARGPLEVICDKTIAYGRHYARSLGAKRFCSGRFFQASSLWDGELAHGIMRQAYRTGRRDVYEAAIHHAYAVADIALDHADFTFPVSGMPKDSISLVLHRNIGMLAGYLETGDPYLLHCAESLSERTYSIDRGNWPRRSYGRDSSYIRGLTRLYDVTGQSFYLQRAGEACHRLIQCQRADGSFSDQGGAQGAHGHLNEHVKPWMNSILAEVLVDYLERAGRDPALEAALSKTADWLLSTLKEDKHGKYWPYQTGWGQNEEDPSAQFHVGQKTVKFPLGFIQLDYNARTLLWVSRLTGDARYARGWQATFQRQYVTLKRLASAYGNVKVPDNFPWHEAHLWGARWDGQNVSFQPLLDLIEVGRQATIELPNGHIVRVCRTDKGIETI